MNYISYHQQTKHSYTSIRQNSSYMDWDNQPSQYKCYQDKYKHIELNDTIESHRFIYRIGGISAKKSYSSGEYFLRTNPSAGALFPNEIYFQVRGVDGFEDGIYHFEVKTSTVVLLYTLKHDGVEKYLGLKSAVEGFIFLTSSVYFRSSWKYKDRSFRYCLLDGGHILGQIEASAYLMDFAVRHIYCFEKIALNEIFGFENREFFISASVVGIPRGKLPDSVEFSLPFVDSTGRFIANKSVEEVYQKTLLCQNPRFNNKASNFNFRKDVFEETIFRRRSIRQMHKEAISKDSFLFIMDVINQSVMSDCDEEVDIYVILNRVIDMPVGLYHCGKFLKYGDFSKKAGYLCLEQYHLGQNSALTIFLASKSKNYQAMYQKAGIIGNRIYLSSTYMQIGCSGIGAYYDDEVAEFLNLDDEYMILYGICVGN